MLLTICILYLAFGLGLCTSLQLRFLASMDWLKNAFSYVVLTFGFEGILNS